MSPETATPAGRAEAVIDRSPTLERVRKGELCSGCGLCAGVSGGAVTLETIAPGYTRPAQRRPIAASAERTIAAACPGARVAPWPRGRDTNPYWGPCRDVLTGHATDAELRFVASSGGALSALLLAALDAGMVDAVLHIGADPDRPTRNVLRWSIDRQGVLEGAGSRYAASSPLEEIGAALDAGRRFAFVGKPCDVSALRLLATVDPRVARQVPLMLAFFCGGVPSHDGSDRIVRKMGLEPQAVRTFRYRGHGWPGLSRAETVDGAVGEMTYAESWGGHLSKEVQFRCKICPDAVGGVADVAVADAWYGGESGYPTFDELDGRSLIVVRTARGQELIDAATRAGQLAAEPLATDQIDLMQPSQARRKRMVFARLAACAVMLQPRPRVAGLDVLVAARRGSMRESAKNFLGTMRRIAQGRR